MDEETIKRIECKIDYLAGVITALIGLMAAFACIHFHAWGSWSGWIGGIGAVILPAYLLSQYRDI